ncbi:MAG: tyrosine-protein phosphatase [Candidatus Omnitrophica bacterium]|nr:tyrosine-protein phosphatase [Candidatus Omnitrophota bacterium]
MLNMKILAIFLFIGLLFIPGCASLDFLKPAQDIPVFHQVDNRLYRGATPNEKGFQQLLSKGIRTIISLKKSNEASAYEQETANALGIKFYNLPLDLYQKPDDKTVLKFLEIVMEKAGQPVFVYCSNGKDRTGAMIAMYRVVVSQLTIKQAYKEAKKYGFWPYYGDTPELKDFVHQLKDKTIYFEKAKELKNAEKN